MSITRDFPDGTISYKSHAEYYPPGYFLRGKPYYYVTTALDGRFHLWQYQKAADNYLLLKSGDEFVPLYEEGLALEDKIRQQRIAMQKAGLSIDEILEKETVP